MYYSCLKMNYSLFDTDKWTPDSTFFPGMIYWKHTKLLYKPVFSLLLFLLGISKINMIHSVTVALFSLS